MLNTVTALLTIFLENVSSVIELLIVVALFLFILKHDISGRVFAIIGFILLGIVCICSMIGFSSQARLLAEYMWIFFFFSFCKEFIHFLRHENR